MHSRPSRSAVLVSLLTLAAAVASGCGEDASPASLPLAEGHPVYTAYAPAGAACTLGLTQVALYQGVKVVLGRDGVEMPARSADVIAGRPGLLRAFVTIPAGAEPVAARMRVTLRSGESAWSRESDRVVSASSRDEDLASTFNFDVPADVITADTTASVEMVEPIGCTGPGASTRFPSQGEARLRALQTGVLKLRLVPLRYDTDGSGRLPDTSPAEIERARAALMAMLPVAGVEIEVREPVSTMRKVTADAGWSELLDEVRQLRARDGASADVYYFGLVDPAATGAAYCGAGCISGNSYRTGAGNADLRVSVGLGYPGEANVESMIHELGHSHGRKHAPCGAPPDPDPGFPQANGAIGEWGWDARFPDQLIPPATGDVMSYCGKRWISPYTFQALAERSAQVNRARPQR